MTEESPKQPHGMGGYAGAKSLARNAIRETLFAAAVCVLGMFATYCAACYWYMESVPISAAKLGQLHRGMPESRIVELLGPPPIVESGGSSWTYATAHQWTVVHIRLSGGQLESVEVDR